MGTRQSSGYARQGPAVTQTPAHDWLLPRLLDLLEQAQAAGIPQEVAVAVLADLIEGSECGPATDKVDSQ